MSVAPKVAVAFLSFLKQEAGDISTHLLLAIYSFGGAQTTDEELTDTR